MNQIIERLYQEIGLQAVEFADDLAGRLLVYAEVEEGVISADMFYVSGPAGTVRFRECPPTMLDLIEELWARWKELPGNREWRVLAYVIDGERFSIDLTYPDQIDEDQDVADRRPVAVKKYFGDAKVNYSEP